MNRYIGAVVLVSVAMCWAGFAEATLLPILSISPDPLVGSPGDTRLTSVEYTAQGAQVAGLQFDVLYDPSALSLSGAVAGSAAILASKDQFSFNTGSPGDTTFIIFGFNQNVFGDGSVADLTFQVNSNAPAGPYNLFLSGSIGSDSNGSPVPITNLNPPPIGAVPESSTWLLLGIGLAGLVAWRWKQAA
jgi:hypothetical protein